MLIVALTGGIASGKSIIADVLHKCGCHIDPADRVAHDIMKPDEPVWKRIVAHFGTDILNPDRTINRVQLGDILFDSSEARNFVNGLVHPLVMDRMKAAIARLEKEERFRIFVSEAALTIEAGTAEFFDKIIVAYCPEDIQIQRLMKRDGIGEKAALSRVRAQMPAEEKLAYADYVIDTSGTMEETIEQAEDLYEKLLLDHKIKKQEVENS